MSLERWIDKDTNTLKSYGWPGGCPIYYIDGFNCVLCPNCANDYFKEPDEDQRFNPKDGDIYYEGPVMFCEKCNVEIESAYGDPDEEKIGENENE
jgi:hypothetical protein